MREVHPLVGFARPAWAPVTVWHVWLQRVRDGAAQASVLSLRAFYGNTRRSGTGAEPPRRRVVATASRLGRDEFNRWCARIEAGRCDPRFVVGINAIMWDASRLTSPTR